MGHRKRKGTVRTEGRSHGPAKGNQAPSSTGEAVSRLDKFMGDHLWDMKVGAINLVSDTYARKESPFGRMVGMPHGEDWYLDLRMGGRLKSNSP